MILRVRFALSKHWKPELGYLDLERKMAETGIHNPDARQIFDWVVAIRRAKLPDPAVIGTKPLMARSNVDLPAPERPTMTASSPDSMVNETFLSA